MSEIIDPPVLVVCRQCGIKVKNGPGISLVCPRCGGTLADPAEMAAGLPLQGQMLMSCNLTGDYDEQESSRTPTTDPRAANLITSELAGHPGWHRPVLDIDLPVTVLPSSTPGHFHLYIDKMVPWPIYLRLLDVLRQAGIVEQGYYDTASRRGHTAVRLPWVRKGASS